MSNERLSAADIAQSLGRGKEVKLSDGRWNTCCPAHNDDGPSLSVSDAGDGRILVHCHAGCKSEEVIDALRSKGLWPSKKKTWKALDKAPKGCKACPEKPQHFKLGTPKMRWEYRDKKGDLVGYVFRFEKTVGDKVVKEMVPMTWCREEEEGTEGWHWKSFNKLRPLYRGHLIYADKKRTILVVEGEKTADAAAAIFGDDYHVVAWPGGTGAAKFADWETLKGREVVLWPDADTPGHKASKTIAEILILLDCIVKKVVLPETLEQIDEGWDLADEIPQGLDMDLRLIAGSAPIYKPVGDSVVDKYNREFAMVMLGDKAVILKEETDARGRITPRFISLSGFKDFYRNETVKVGRAEKPAPNYWLDHPERRSYPGVVFEPGRSGEPNYNLWRGIAYEPDPTGDWSLLKEHMLQNIAQGDESLYNWVFGWFAQMYQQPSYKLGTSLAVRGRMGSGKTILGKLMGEPIRSHYTLVENQRYITGQFNSHLSTTMLLHADEAFFAGDPRVVNQLKGMVTSDTHRIEYKGKESFEVPNYTRLFASSNHDFVIPAGFEERRFAVIDCGDGRIQQRAYFKAMQDQLKNGGYEGLVHELMNFDLTCVDLGRIPRTKALAEQKFHSMPAEMRFWNERLEDENIIPDSMLGWPDWISSEMLYKAFMERCQLWGVKYRNDSRWFWKEIRKLMGPFSQRVKRNYTEQDWRSNDVRKQGWGYTLPPLDICHKRFNDIIEGADYDMDDVVLGNVNGYVGSSDHHEDHPQSSEDSPERDVDLRGRESYDDIPF